MKVLAHRSIDLESLKKNLRMLWKPNKGVQIFEIEEELYLVEFGDGCDKKKILEMCLWSYEKQPILLKESKDELVPKDISIWQSPFWIQIFNLPLKSRISETGQAIGSKVGEVMAVDVSESGIHWGKYLRVRVKIDVTKKLVRGKKVMIEGGKQWWISFKYDGLPNFCYCCGLLSHDLRDCSVTSEKDNHAEQTTLQYGEWMRGEVLRRSGTEVIKGGLNDEVNNKGKPASNEGRTPERENHAPPARKAMGADEGSTLQNIGERYRENETNGANFNYQTPGNHHERRMDESIETNTGSIFPFQGKENLNVSIT